MVECNSIESIELNPIDTSNLNSQQFRLNKISEIEDYFITKIKERELMSEKLSKYISFFDYFDKSLFVLSVTSGSVSIASFATVTGIPVGIAAASLSLTFSLCKGLVEKLLKATKNKKKKHNKIVMLARSKLSSIESKISAAILSYCLKFKKNTESIDPKVSAASNGKTMILSKCNICNSKKSKFIKKQQANGLLSNLSVKTPLAKVPLLGGILF